MKIKTVCKKISSDGLTAFDEEVNELLSSGWQLAKREVLPGYNLGDVYFAPCYYAELVKLDEADMAADLAELREAEPVTWQEAVEVLRETCRTAEDCTKDGCPAFDWCQKNVKDDAPFINWSEPAE